MPVKSAKSFGVKALGQGLGADTERVDPDFNQVTLLLHADGQREQVILMKLALLVIKHSKIILVAIIISLRMVDAFGNSNSPYTRADGYWSTTFNGNANQHIRYQGYREQDQFNLDDRASWCVDFWLFMDDNTHAYQRVAEMYNSGSYWAIKFNIQAMENFVLVDQMLAIMEYLKQHQPFQKKYGSM